MKKQTKFSETVAAFWRGRGAAAAAAGAAFFCAADAHAYIDPGSGGALITAILGAIGAVGYTFRKYYYKIKQLFGKRGGGKPK